jgi:hypothetical protein
MDAWLESFIAQESQAERVDGWVERITAPVLAENPEVADDPALARMVGAAVRSHWLAFLASLAQPEQEHRLVLPAAELAGELARRRYPSTLLFRVYRVGQQATWDYATTVTESLEGYDVASADVLVFFWNRASASPRPGSPSTRTPCATGSTRPRSSWGARRTTRPPRPSWPCATTRCSWRRSSREQQREQ